MTQVCDNGTITEPQHLWTDPRGATSLEWALLLAAVAVPAYWLMAMGIDLMIGYYQMMTTLNALPFP